MGQGTMEVEQLVALGLAILLALIWVLLARAALRTADATEGAWAESIKQTSLLTEQIERLEKLAEKLSAPPRA